MADLMLQPLIVRIRPLVPLVDETAAAWTVETLSQHAAETGQDALWQKARPVLEPIAGASSYLAGLMRRDPHRVFRILSQAPETRLEAILLDVATLEAIPETLEISKKRLRQLKGELHLLTALADLGGIWGLDQVTGALTRFADACCRAALRIAALQEQDKGRLIPVTGEDPDAGPVPGLFALAMGKHGAFELNYSSDIDVTFFFEPERLPLKPGVEGQGVVNRLAQLFTNLLSDRTADGYVFRVDLRLRPDPSSTPPVVSVGSALAYYESVGQNWERAAYIKARPVLGDLHEARSFLEALRPFVWRRSLDYPAIADVHSIKRQIHVYRADTRLEAAGANLKLGAGGIREIEFFAQTQQLILGGRDPSLRSNRTIEALDALRKAGHLAPAVCKELKAAYGRLRAWEHRVQMLEDEQTHTLPEDPAVRLKVAALSGASSLSRYDGQVSRTLKTVNTRYGELFASDEQLSSDLGSLVFTGIEDDPETLNTLKRMGFEDPAHVSGMIRSWHHGRIPATRTERGRELFTRLAPRLLDAAHATGAPNAAFRRFSVFFSGLSAGVQVQSLFLAKPKLFQMVVEMMAFSPRLATQLGRRPAIFDALLDANFFAPLGEEVGHSLTDSLREPADSFEDAMNRVRRAHREQAFRIGLHILNGRVGTTEAGAAYARLADAAITALAPEALRETSRLGGVFPGKVAVIGLGKLGSQEMTATSDLDLMTVYWPETDQSVSDLKGWASETFYSRFTQRLIAALSAPTAEGQLYDIDMKLRPTGAKGPVAVSLKAFADYYGAEAETWEFLALCRARVIWASHPGFAETCQRQIEAALRQPRDPFATARDVRAMRDLMDKERPPHSVWDLKLMPGGQVDAEFAAQALQIIYASGGGPLRTGTVAALQAMSRARLADDADLEALSNAWSVQQGLTQLMRVALEARDDPAKEPSAFQRKLARAARSQRLDTLQSKLKTMQGRARAAFYRILEMVR
ncbi:MAG: bifunctional [glutamine synthetase] adenylyltransferase/[glutamine synthetase]-adenylyl-L-tyrosine phosphorylase [Asticcacaulis sp.]